MKRIRTGFAFLLMFISFSFFAGGEESAREKEDSRIIDYLEFREVDIKDVLRQLAKQFDLNIVFSEAVQGAVTVQLQSITVEEALDSIITINGFAYMKKGKIIKVTTPEGVESESKQTRVFRLNNAEALKLKDTLAKVLSPEGTIEADTRSNSLIVTDNPSVIIKLENMVPSLDEITPQVLIEARFIETSLEATEKLGINWNVTATVTGASKATTLPFDSDGGESWLKNITPLSDSEGEDFPPSSHGFPYSTTDDFSFGTLDFTDFQTVLDLLLTESNSELLSSPRIVTLDNKEAEIQVGETRYIRTEETYDEDNDEREYEYEEKKLGVILKVTPRVIPDGHINLVLNPEVSSYKGDDSNGYPIISTRIAKTEVLIRNGQTIVIGGLMKNESTVTEQKVPFLGDIPFLGHLFKHKEVNPDSQTDLLIFVTARVVGDNEDGLLAYKSDLKTTPVRPLKLELREIKPGR